MPESFYWEDHLWAHTYLVLLLSKAHVKMRMLACVRDLGDVRDLLNKALLRGIFHRLAIPLRVMEQFAEAKLSMAQQVLGKSIYEVGAAQNPPLEYGQGGPTFATAYHAHIPRGNLHLAGVGLRAALVDVYMELEVYSALETSQNHDKVLRKVVEKMCYHSVTGVTRQSKARLSLAKMIVYMRLREGGMRKVNEIDTLTHRDYVFREGLERYRDKKRLPSSGQMRYQKKRYTAYLGTSWILAGTGTSTVGFGPQFSFARVLQPFRWRNLSGFGYHPSGRLEGARSRTQWYQFFRKGNRSGGVSVSEAAQLPVSDRDTVGGMVEVRIWPFDIGCLTKSEAAASYVTVVTVISSIRAYPSTTLPWVW
ncbi:hypothetical protein R3P38DRAFT_3373295 [Favolaschia claudopus]|uniref:Uncharacterized protein n=1 Tax=Favolaschia claudopus TaxID=2862362 RepID=A0AAV9ZTP3_9AGAR